MVKKILIISPTPTHPPHAGNSSSILTYSQFLSKMGFDVYFMYMGEILPEESIKLLNDYWGKKLITITPGSYIWKIRIYKYLRRLLTGTLSYKIDDWFPWCVTKRLKNIQKIHKFDIVWVNYIWMSKALTLFKGARKVLDTHDIFSFRYEKTGNNWYSTTPEEEAKALNRGDFIVAVQEKEGAYFEQLTTKKVITTFRPFPYKRTPLCNNNNLLFMAGPNQPNVEALNFILREVFPLLILDNPEIRLLIGGSICDLLSREIMPFGVSVIGKISNLEDFYTMGNIVLNPIKQGSGLKIKTIEALSFGKILITHPHNIIGVPFPDEIPVLLAESVEEYRMHISRIMQSGNKMVEIKDQDFNYMSRYNEIVLSRMTQIVNLNS